MSKTLNPSMNPNLPRLKSVRALPGRKLKLVWQSGETRLCGLTGLIARVPALTPLADATIFAGVKMIDWGAAVGWSNGLDLSAQTLHQISGEQQNFGAQAFRKWQTELNLSNQEAADALGLALGTIKNYRKGNVIPLAIAVACRAMLNDPHVIAAHYRPRKPGRPYAEA